MGLLCTIKTLIISFAILGYTQCVDFVITGLSSASSEQSATYTQSSKMTYFRLDNSAALTDMDYILVELEIDYSIMQTMQNQGALPMLCYEFDNSPVVSQDAFGRLTTPCANGYDLNQYTRATGKYSVLVQTKGIASYSYLKFGVFMNTNSKQFGMRFRGRFSSMTEDICAFDCSAGASSSDNCRDQTCICPAGKIDYDCSQLATQITDDGTKISVVSAQMAVLYYKSDVIIKSSSDAKSIKIQFTLDYSSPSIAVFTTISGLDPSIAVPTTDSYFAVFYPQSADYDITLKPSVLYDDFLDARRIAFGIMITSGTLNYVTVRVKPDEDSSGNNMLIIFFLIGMVAFLLVIWIILTIIKIRFAKRNQVHDLSQLMLANLSQQRLNGQRRNQAGNGGGAGAAGAADPNSNKLTEIVINEYMPVTTFGVLVKQFKQQGKPINESCAVCLCDFEEPDKCRNAICNHYFHQDCLEQWLKKYENCPFCRADLSKASLLKSRVDASAPPQEAGASNPSVRAPVMMNGARMSVVNVPPANLNNNSGQSTQMLNEASRNHIRQQGSIQIQNNNSAVRSIVAAPSNQAVAGGAAAAAPQSQSQSPFRRNQSEQRLRMTQVQYNQVNQDNSNNQGNAVISVSQSQQNVVMAPSLLNPNQSFAEDLF